MSTRELSPCMMCGTPTVDQWGGYCHDCDNYFEAVIAEQQLELQQETQAGLFDRPIVKERD